MRNAEISDVLFIATAYSFLLMILEHPVLSTAASDNPIIFLCISYFPSLIRSIFFAACHYAVN